MHTNLAWLLVASTPVASALAAASDPAGFTLHQVATGNKRFLNGAIDRQQVHQKYNKRVPASVARAAAAALQSGTAPATPADPDDSEYLTPVSIGTPAQMLSMELDTGLADFYVCCTEQPASQRGSSHTCYNPRGSSSTKKYSGESWSLAFGDGSSASGDVYYDKVVIGGVTATSQAVECATNAPGQFTGPGDYDGVVGLAFSSLNSGTPNRLSTFWQNIAPTVASKVFAAWLKRGRAGAFDIGYLNSSHYTAPVVYTPVNNAQGFWEFNTTAFSVGSTTYNKGYDVIADTGTSIIYLPDAVVKQYYSQVSGASYSSSQGGYIFSCQATLPNFGLTIGGRVAIVPGAYIKYAPIDSFNCYGGLQSSSDIGVNILGNVFIKSQYVVFDFGATRIGFATQK